MSLCDRCFSPGACCKGMTFNGLNEITDPDEAREAMQRQAEHEGTEMPFEPWQRVASVEFGNFWRWICTKLDADGRCSIYDSRPKACQVFEPASDRLCVHYGGAEAGDPTVMA